MKLKDLLRDVNFELINGTLEEEISSLVYDSRKAGLGSAFLCIRGTSVNGHDYIEQVIEKGVKVIILEEEKSLPPNITGIKVEDTRLALALLSATWFDYPAKKLTTIGVTGTKGKTTTTYMIKEILEKDGRKTGLIGTIETIIGDERIPSLNTTPESYLVQESFFKMVKAGCSHVVMEVSSQALMMKRVAGFEFDYGIFTNIEPDHIGPNEHKDFNDYLNSKSLLFRQCKKGIFNLDAEHLEEILATATCEKYTFGMMGEESADVTARDVGLVKTLGSLGVSAKIHAFNEDFDVIINMPGLFSIHNALGSITVAKLIGVSTSAIKEALASVRVNGRVELMPVSDKFTVIIDYAHNAMGLTSLLTTLREYKPKRLVTLFGCGGNRDRKRRFEMGEVSSKLSDLTVITSDNPRFEKPLDIIEDIITGVKKAEGSFLTIPDRITAIQTTIKNAEEGDVIIIAGKGHEDYQEIEGVKHHMNDHEIVMSVL